MFSRLRIVIAMCTGFGLISCGEKTDLPGLEEHSSWQVLQKQILSSETSVEGFYADSTAFSSVEADEPVVLGLSLKPEDYYCPTGYSYSATIRLCVSEQEAIGPFPTKMRQLCSERGGGAACQEDNWARSFSGWLRGKGVCPFGSNRDASTGLCIEGEMAYGPFTKKHVENCSEAGGGNACFSLRWSKGFAERTLPKDVAASETFPFDGPADLDYYNAPRSFGSCRSGCRRKHAAADLYSAYGRPIYAVADGVIKDFYYFYDNTYAIVVDHGSFMARYGEIQKRLPRGVRVGARVERGQHIASIGDLASLSVNMLHFEKYTGKGTGQLTQRNNYPYQRRWDLVNPTKDLDSWEYPR